MKDGRDSSSIGSPAWDRERLRDEHAALTTSLPAARDPVAAAIRRDALPALRIVIADDNAGAAAMAAERLAMPGPEIVLVPDAPAALRARGDSDADHRLVEPVDDVDTLRTATSAATAKPTV